jgi:hypothetical protein
MNSSLIRLKKRLIRSSAKANMNQGIKGNILKDAHMDSPCVET